jgi:hypothetical protein
MYIDNKKIKFGYDMKITALTLSYPRNKIISDIIIELLEKYNDRKILILSGRCGKND